MNYGQLEQTQGIIKSNFKECVQIVGLYLEYTIPIFSVLIEDISEIFRDYYEIYQQLYSAP